MVNNLFARRNIKRGIQSFCVLTLWDVANGTMAILTGTCTEVSLTYLLDLTQSFGMIHIRSEIP